MEQMGYKQKDLARLVGGASRASEIMNDKRGLTTDMIRREAASVQCHPDHGEDSPLYRAIGFVTFSERKTGLIRRPKVDSGPPVGNDEAAA